MKVLCGESEDKKQRYILDIPKDMLIELLKEDHGYHEVIDMLDPTIELRIYFDIEAYDTSKDILNDVIQVLNKQFNCSNNSWAICECNRRDKLSYHVLSKQYKMSLNNLRALANKLQKELKYIDTSAYWFSMSYCLDEGSLRLPNQSKSSIHKEGHPFKILQGDIEDFLVTFTDNLELYTLDKCQI